MKNKAYILIVIAGSILVLVVFSFKQGFQLGERKAVSYHQSEHTKEDIRSGDIIFQTSLSSQSKAIQLATHSKYSHMGIVYRNGDDYFVYEAVQPVKLTSLEDWIERGENNHYVVKRLKNADEVLTTAVLHKRSAIFPPF